MSETRLACSIRADDAENIGSNASHNPTISDILALRLSRRDVMAGLLATTSASLTASTASLIAAPPGVANAAQPATAAPPATTPTFTFDELSAGIDETHHVAKGYDADILIRWGDGVLGDAPRFDPAAQTADAQARQFGYNNDFIGFIPLDGSSQHGLLVVNHEYTNRELMFPGFDDEPGKAATFERTTREQIAIEMSAHGGSVIEVERKNGKWSVVAASRYARRITAETPMRISGPAAGHTSMRTKADPSGTQVLGMINNCAGATTPWGTWLTCEENFNGYFWGKGKLNKATDPTALKRYSIPGEWYAWAKFHDRFDVIEEPSEAHRFGWVVEIDPFDPNSTPVKRTALGRFKHEGAGNIVNRDGRFVVYQGDDEKFEYVYRFVTKRTVDPVDRAANLDILDEGTLFVARFDADGSGRWLPLVHNQGPLNEANGFRNQGDVVIRTRQAADLLGATKMDRPEDIEANAKTGKVYLMLTNNNKRDTATLDAANPRADNKFGHIIEMTPEDGDHAADVFRWEILVRCGDPAIAAVGATFNPLTSKDGWFGMPDNCAIDSLGRLWIATDGNSQRATGRADGIWAMETAGAARGTSKLFFSCPVGAEMCGPAFTPDAETLFVAVQHPGEGDEDGPSTFAHPTTRWPDFAADMPPRPSVVAITRKGGGKIGT